MIDFKLNGGQSVAELRSVGLIKGLPHRTAAEITVNISGIQSVLDCKTTKPTL